MFNKQSVGLALLGSISGIVAAWTLTSEMVLVYPLYLLPGAIFAIFIIIGLYIFYNKNNKLQKNIIFIILSSICYALAFWIVVLMPDSLTGIITFPMASFISAIIMLLGLNKLIPISKNILKLALLSSILTLIAIFINHYAYYTLPQDFILSPVKEEHFDSYLRATVEMPNGLSILHVLWNTLMAFAIARSIDINKLQAK